MAELKGSREREDNRDVLLLVGLFANDFHVRTRSRGEPAREGRVGVDIEFEEVEEGVVDGRDGAVLLTFDAVVEFERFAGFFADGEGSPLDFLPIVLYVLTGFAVVR